MMAMTISQLIGLSGIDLHLGFNRSGSCTFRLTERFTSSPVQVMTGATSTLTGTVGFVSGFALDWSFLRNRELPYWF
jgi:hypothetical protein